MKKNEKIEYISLKIAKQGRVSVASLAKEMNITEKTVRLYLEQLEKAGILIRTFGGAILNNSFNEMFPITNSYRTRANNLKRQIALKALKLIKENETIILDDGSTCLELAKALGNFNLTVITNDTVIIQELEKKEKIHTIVVGGEITKSYQQYCTVGKYACSFVKQFQVDKYFLGISSVDTNAGLMIFHHGDAKYKNVCRSIAKETICLADSEKYNKTSFIKVCDYADVDYIITDSKLDTITRKKYKTKKPKMII